MTISFGAPTYHWRDGFNMAGNASPQKQVEYLLNVLQVQSNEMDTLRLQLRTVDLQNHIKVHEMDTMIENLWRTQQWLKNRKRDSETTKSIPFLKRLRTLKIFPSSSKLFTVLLISFFAVAGFLLALSLSPKTGL